AVDAEAGRSLEQQLVWVTQGSVQLLDSQRKRRVIAAGQVLYIHSAAEFFYQYQLTALPNTELYLLPTGPFLHLLLTDPELARTLTDQAELFYFPEAEATL
ncbi:MAG TPA: hypothetical protein DCR93_21035, partial [Cytophagales bacterium]|nr:hypothetical protein [Cytophagales bacterium]